MRATLAIATIQPKLAELDDAQARDPVSSGLRAALWRAQHEAARRGRTLEDLRRGRTSPRLIGPELPAADRPGAARG